MDQYLTLDEVARKLKVNKQTVYRMARRKQIPAVKFGKMWRINENELKKMLIIK